MTTFGLIGYPLGHSFSKTYFLQKFAKENLNYLFELYPIKNINEFAELLQANPALKGLAVTIPYKQSVIHFLNSISEEAEKIGAVNCISFKNGLLCGYNTDVIGFEKSFKSGLEPHHKKALVLGTGGSSKAVLYVLEKHGIDYKLVSRNNNENASFLQYSDIDESLLAEYSIIINCTPVGMFPKEMNKPEIPYQFLTTEHYLFDLVYKPEETLFLKEGKKKGALVKNGFEMLVIQADENWKIWQSTL